MTYHEPGKPKHFEDRHENRHAVPDGASKQVETTEHIGVSTPPEISGMGHRMKRKEDPRFIRGIRANCDEYGRPVREVSHRCARNSVAR